MPPTRNGQPRRRFPAEILSDAEVRQLLDACNCRSPTGVRNRTLIAVLYRGGLRINEALDLFPKDVDLVSLPKTSSAAFLRGVATHASGPTLPRASGICRHHEAGVDSSSPARRTAAAGSD